MLELSQNTQGTGFEPSTEVGGKMGGETHPGSEIIADSEGIFITFYLSLRLLFKLKAWDLRDRMDSGS